MREYNVVDLKPLKYTKICFYISFITLKCSETITRIIKKTNVPDNPLDSPDACVENIEIFNEISIEFKTIIDNQREIKMPLVHP